jgi:D-alanyl-lipoteichoic acid acyltransferase DltB (MBOAT superfamily)
MNFASTIFLQFFAIFLLAHHLVARHRTARNALILGASYFFYGCWDWRFLGLIVFSTAVDFVVALRLYQTERTAVRRIWLALSVFANLGLLAYFKYAGFFADSLVALAARVGWTLDDFSLHVVLPVGISFYTFQTLGYTLDVYHRRIAAERDPLCFAAYVAFFPQLVAGPIERASRLLPQFHRAQTVTPLDVEQGLWLILRGYFKKVVIADQLAPLVELIYGTPSGPLPLALGTLAFALQIYGDFSGYSDIARGTARWLGFDLMLNFRQPYFATSLRDFWARWHISLSTWLRDYLYIPLGGNRLGRARTALNLILTMTLGGLWHGAAWTFVAWGLWHGVGLAARRLAGDRRLPTPLAWLATQLFVLAGWTLFRVGSFAQLAQHLQSAPWPVWWSQGLQTVALLGAATLAVDILENRRITPPVLVQGLMALAVLLFWEMHTTPFIYFQF